MSNIHTEIEIEASQQAVWDILTDFDNYQQWNPFVQRVSGRAQAGERFKVFIKPPDRKGMTFKPRIMVFEPNREFQWTGKLVSPKLLSGRHTFRVEPIDENHVRFVQEEEFTGILSDYIMKRYHDDTVKGLENSNQALKKKAETHNS